MRYSLICAVVAFVAGSASAVIIPAATSAGPVPAAPGDGLNGTIWLSGYQGSSLVSNLAYTLATPPSGTFRSTVVDYPLVGDFVQVGDPLANLLGADAASIVGFDPAAQNSSGHLYLFRGFLAVAQAGTVRLGVGSDDGFAFAISNIEVASFDGERGFAYTFGDATFEAAGLYPINIFFYSNFAGESGVTFAEQFITGTIQTVDGSRLYTVPGPAAATLGALGGLLAARRRR